MKKKISLFMLTFALLAGGQAQAATYDSSAASDTQVSREEQAVPKEPVTLKTEKMAIGPQLGIINYTDSTGEKSSRGTVGVNIEWNAASLIGESPNIYAGFQTGAFIAKTGGSDANFFGGNSNAAAGFDGATIITAPINAKVGYNVTDKARISVHGGGNAIYRSSAGAVLLGSTDAAPNDNAWNIYPNVGGDVELQVSKNLGILARPDLTLTGGENMFVGTLAANFLF